MMPQRRKEPVPFGPLTFSFPPQAVGTLAWLQPLIEDVSQQPHWRRLVYKLSEQCDKNYFLDQTVKSIAEKGALSAPVGSRFSLSGSGWGF